MYITICNVELALIFTTPNIVAVRKLKYNDSNNPLNVKDIFNPLKVNSEKIKGNNEYIIANKNIEISHDIKKFRNEVFLIHSNNPTFSVMSIK
jgi:hypothetical protein